MVWYYLEVDKRSSGWAVFLWRTSWFSTPVLIKSAYRNTQKEIEAEVEVMKANKDKYIKEYEEGVRGHKYIPL